MNLANVSILVTRPEPQGAELCQQITELGGHAISFPTIAFAPPPDADAFANAIAQLGGQEWLVFISPQAVRASVPAIRQRWTHLPSTVKFAAVGAGTAKALKAAGYDAALQPSSEWSSEALLALPEFQNVKDKHIAVIRGVGGRGLLIPYCRIAAQTCCLWLPMREFYPKSMPGHASSCLIKVK